MKNETWPKRETRGTADIPDREELIAAVCAALAEMLGADVSKIRVLSFKRA